MAKKAPKKTKKRKQKDSDSPTRNKAEIRAYYKENGWRATISNFRLSPKEASAIIGKSKGSTKKAPKKKTAGKKRGRPGKKAKAKKAPKKKAGKKRGRPKGSKNKTKAAAPKKKAGKRGRPKGSKNKAKAAAPKKKTGGKKRGRPPGSKNKASPTRSVKTTRPSVTVGDGEFSPDAHTLISQQQTLITSLQKQVVELHQLLTAA